MKSNKNLHKLLSVLTIVFLIAAAIPLKTNAAASWTNLSAPNVGNNTATIKGTITETKDTNTANYSFEYTKNPDFSNATKVPGATTAVLESANSSSTTVTRDLTGLSAGTTYYYRVIFTSGAVTVASAWSLGTSFTTTGQRTLLAGSSALSEKILNQVEITLSVSSDKFNPTNTVSYLQLNNAPPGTTIGTVSFHTESVLRIKLNHDGTDFDTDYNSFSITVKEGGFITTGSATSNVISVKSFIEIDGYADYYSLGRSFPIRVEMNGYNVRDKKIHITTDLHTNLTVAADKTATFHYYVDVFDGTGVKIGYFGTYDAPKLAAAQTTGLQGVTLNDIAVPLTAGLTPAYRIVIIVKEVVLN